MTRFHLAVPPNIARKVMGEVGNRFPGATLSMPQTHGEMSRFFHEEFGEPAATADLTVTAHPSALARACQMPDAFEPMPEDLPQMRSELRDAGLLENAPFFKVIGVVTMMILHHRSVDPPPCRWADLCREDLADAMVIPPDTTPAPAIYAYYMEKLAGPEGAKAASLAHARLLPQDINKSVDEGAFKAGMAFPAFARTSRNNNAVAVWPEEGAVAIPLVGFLKKGAGEDAADALRYLCGDVFQTLLAKDGLFCPILASVPLFDEMSENNARLAWCGWDDYVGL